MFAGFAASGISTFEQIENASDQSLIGILANLEKQGFAFAKFEENVEELAKKLDDLERDRVVNIKLKVTTDADPASEKLLNNSDVGVSN